MINLILIGLVMITLLLIKFNINSDHFGFDQIYFLSLLIISLILILFAQTVLILIKPNIIPDHFCFGQIYFSQFYHVVNLKIVIIFKEIKMIKVI